MKKNLLLMIAFSTSIFTASLAQVSATPEVPKNYKPAPKELLPMPGELTDEMIFPVLGKYEYTDNDGNISNVTVSRDPDNKGAIWVNGLAQGKFKANLKMSPATYKIPVQKTLQNDWAEDSNATVSAAPDDKASAKATARYSGKTLQEGTLIFDSVSNKLYVNVGSKYNEEDPASVFPEIEAAADSTSATAMDNDIAMNSDNEKTSGKKKAPFTKGTTYILTKIVDMSATSSVSPADSKQ